MCSILIDQKEYSIDKDGINIVVYDEISKQVIDSFVLEDGCRIIR